MSDFYDVLILPTHIGAIKDRENNTVKPFIAAYLPDELLKKMDWTKETRLRLSVEKGYLKIEKTDSDEQFYFDSKELTYEIDSD